MNLRLRNVRTHNLKGIDLDLPLGRLIVVTGVSGAGKSSLVFDTIYAEGRRRYIETFSPRTRQFLETFDRPDADQIDGLPPALAPGGASALATAAGRRPAFGTVGTLADVQGPLALSFARLGAVVCRGCGVRVVPATVQAIGAAIDALPERARYQIVFPIDLLPGSDRAALAREWSGRGFTRIVADGQTVRLDDPGAERVLASAGPWDVVVDRLVRGADPGPRRDGSLESALSHGMGRCRVLHDEGAWTFTRDWRCPRCGLAHLAPGPNLFRFQDATGACPACEGRGRVPNFDEGQSLDRGRAFSSRSKSAQRWRTCPECQGARLRPEALAVRIAGRNIAELQSLSVRELRAFLNGPGRLEMGPATDPADAGPTIGRAGSSTTPIGQAEKRLLALEELGLGHLTLDREAGDLSSGELQRVALARALESGLAGALIALDEPTVGLHPADEGRLLAALTRLRDRGDTLLVVDHSPAIIRAADHVVDLGPGAGEAGGHLMYSGPFEQFEAAQGSATSDFVFGRKSMTRPAERRKAGAGGWLELKGARGRNLKSIDVRFPLGTLCVVTGKSGAGKSTLVADTLYPTLLARLAERETRPSAGENPEAPRAALLSPTALPSDGLSGLDGLANVEFLDQSPMPRSARSNAVTHLGAFGEIRAAFAATHEAKLRDYDAGRFSFNVEGGRCDACQGTGHQIIDMRFLPDAIMACPECRGRRYRPEILEITYRGRNIAEVLDLTAREAFAFFRNRPRIQSRLRPLLEIGLDYLRLGQSAATLSSGEAQRLKLARFLARSTAALRRGPAARSSLFLLDEPTAGLHPADIVKLLDALSSLVDRGHSVIAITHATALASAADWVIDLGPCAGDEGGRIVAEGTPETVARSDTPTGRALADALGA